MAYSFQVKRTLYRLVLLILIAGVTFCQSLTGLAAISDEDIQIKIGVLALRGVDHCLQKWTPTAAYLTTSIPGHSFAIVPLRYGQVRQAVTGQKIDFLIANPIYYVEMEASAGIMRVATLVNKSVNGQPMTTYGGTVFTRAERNDINNMKDLVGKSFIGSDPRSLGGWQAVVLELLSHGIKPKRDFASLSFAVSHNEVVYAVRDGEADAGSVRTSTLERMAGDGEINLADFKILQGYQPKIILLPELIPLHSTPPYPEWPLAKLFHTSYELAEQVVIALAQMPADSQAATAASCLGWTIILSYQPVRECLQTLRLPPYKAYDIINIKRLFRQYWLSISCGSCFVLLILLLSLNLLRVNRRLKSAIVTRENELLKRQRAEELLLEREAKLSSIFRAAPAGIGVVIDRVFQEVNQWFWEMVGYSKAELLGKSARMIYPTDADYECVDREKYRQMNERGTITVETRMLSKEGKFIDVLLSTTPLDFDNLSAGVTFIAIDISAIKNTERKLSASEKQYRSMMESMEDLVYIRSVDFRVKYMNPAMIKRIGRDATGEFCFKAIHDFDQRCPFCDLIIEDLRPDIVSPMDNRSFQASCSPIVNDDNSMMIILRDTTDLRKLEAQLFQSQKLEAIGNLAGGIAHDFNNILTAINGYSEIVQMKLEEGSDLWKNVHEIEKAGNRAANLTRQLLAFSRKQLITPKVVNINKLIADMGKMLFRLISEDIRLETSLDVEVGSIYADPVQLEQVLLNLVVNARDAIKNQPETAGKIIIVSTSQVFLGDDYVADHPGSSPGRYLLFQVEDSGCGISKEVFDHVFEPFYTTKAEGLGTGMGLAMVYGIVKQNDGSIYVYSEPGEGTTFKIYWPIIVEEVSSVGDQAREQPSGGTEVILLAEDDEQIRTVISLQLRRAGYTVIEASDGQDALRKAKTYQGDIDLLFTDVVMPVMGGKELSEKIKDIYPNITALFTSGYTDNGIHRDIINLGRNRFINKPYNVNEVMIRIRELLDKVLAENRSRT